MRRYRRHISISTILILIILAVLYYYSNRNGVPITGSQNTQFTPQTVSTGSVPAVTQFGHRTKTSGCEARNGLPDNACTPGDVFPNVTQADICKSGYASSVRNVPSTVKDEVYAEYGIASHSPGEYEVDHLVSLELGGSNDISNLWPELASPTPGFHQKDQVENYLHDQVCSGALSLSQAQQEIATNWLAIYQNITK
jgi:hypothetical protein